jgi:hypothetical protein
LSFQTSHSLTQHWSEMRIGDHCDHSASSSSVIKQRHDRVALVGIGPMQAFYGTSHPLNKALYWAESGDPADLAAASLELERLPARDRRKVLSTYAALIAFKAQRDSEGR